MNTTLLMLEAGAAGAKVIEYSNWTFADRVSEAIRVSLLGIGTVFAVLAVLWGVLEIFRFFFYDLPRKKSGEVKKEEKVKKPAPVAAPAVVPAVSTSSDSEIVAAISAALAVVMDKPATSFRVVSFRRTGTR